MSRDDTGATRRLEALIRITDARARSESLLVEARMATEEARWQRQRLRDTRAETNARRKRPPAEGAAQG